MAVSPILNQQLVAPTQNNKTATINAFLLALEAQGNAPATIDMSGGDVTLSFLQTVSAGIFKTTGLTTNRNLNVPLVTPSALPAFRVFLVRNTSAHDVSVGGPTGARVTVASGDASIIENDGVDCVVFGTGGPGPTGGTGAPGGAISINYEFSTATADADPGNGKLAFDHSTQNLTTTLYLDTLDDAGGDWTSVLDTLDDSTSAAKGDIRIFNRASPDADWLIFKLTSIVTATHYRKLVGTVSGSSSTNPFANTDAIGFVFSRTGDADTSILAANNNWTGAQTQSVTTLTDAATIAVDFALGNNFTVTLGGNRILGNPSNMPGAGKTQSGQIIVIQDGTGSRTLTPAGQWHPVGGAAPALSTAAGAIDILSYTVVTPTYIKYSSLIG